MSVLWTNIPTTCLISRFAHRRTKLARLNFEASRRKSLPRQHLTKVSVSGFPVLDPRDFALLEILAERVPEGNASDSILSIEDDLEGSLDLLEARARWDAEDQ